MSAPKPQPIAPEELPELARSCMAAAKFPMLATCDGEIPRVRPVSPVKTEAFVVTIANLIRYGKTAEIAMNPSVELCYLSPNHDQVRITGVAEVLRDEAEIASIWESNALLRNYLGTPDNPELIIYNVKPMRVRFMREWALEYHEVPL